eukprot:3784172-Pyramimonas_sp.AAC.2
MGVPVELAWVILEPAVNLEGSEQLGKKREVQKMRAAEKREDEGDLAKYSSHSKYRVGRSISQKKGRAAGGAQGRADSADGGEATRATGAKQNAPLGELREGWAGMASAG